MVHARLHPCTMEDLTKWSTIASLVGTERIDLEVPMVTPDGQVTVAAPWGRVLLGHAQPRWPEAPNATLVTMLAPRELRWCVGRFDGAGVLHGCRAPNGATALQRLRVLVRYPDIEEAIETWRSQHVVTSS